LWSAQDLQDYCDRPSMLHLVLASAAVNPSLAAKSNQSAFHDAVWLSWCSLPFMVQSAFYGAVCLSWGSLPFMGQSAFHGAVCLSWCSLPFMGQSAFHGAVCLSCLPKGLLPPTKTYCDTSAYPTSTETCFQFASCKAV